jgi:hypothetical protein
MNTTLSAIVNQALRQALDDEPVHQATRFEIVAFGDPTEAVHHDPADFVAALEDDDRRSLR